MEIEIKGKISADPRDRILAIEAVTKAICQQMDQDPGDGIMMLLTAAAHLTATYSGKTADQNIMTLAACLGNATVAADDFFKLKSAASEAAPSPSFDLKRWAAGEGMWNGNKWVSATPPEDK